MRLKPYKPIVPDDFQPGVLGEHENLLCSPLVVFFKCSSQGLSTTRLENRDEYIYT